MPAGTPLYEIGDYNSAYIRVDVLVDDMAGVKIGQPVVITGDILDGRKIPGVVSYIAPKGWTKVSSLGVEQQRVEVRLRFDNTTTRLKPGYNVDVDLIISEKPSVLYVPAKAVFKLNGQDRVLLVKNERLFLRAVHKGIENDDYIEITSGLTEGEKVVVDPDADLKPGMRVKY